MSASVPLLELAGVEVAYERVISVLRGLSLQITDGTMVALLGPNGAGKTTTMKAISNLLRGERGEITAGTVSFRGERIDTLSADQVVRRGVLQVMEGRRCFAHLSVEENLMAGAHTRRLDRVAMRRAVDRVYTHFPRLKVRRTSAAGLLSGGEQQMCAIGRAMMAGPKLILLDEPSMGLAPQIVDEIFAIIAALNREEGVGILVAEQNAAVALRYASHAYVLEGGRIALGGSSAALRDDPQVRDFYLGTGGDGPAGFRDAKTYGRRALRLI